MRYGDWQTGLLKEPDAEVCTHFKDIELRPHKIIITNIIFTLAA